MSVTSPRAANGHHGGAASAAKGGAAAGTPGPPSRGPPSSRAARRSARPSARRRRRRRIRTSTRPRSTQSREGGGAGGGMGGVRTPGQQKAAERVAQARQDGAITGVNSRMEQLAAAMEVRLQAQESQLMRLAAELQAEREHGRLLEGQLAETNARLGNANGEIEQLRKALDDAAAAHSQLKQEVRWVDESAAKARAQEEEERREADGAAEAQLKALGASLESVAGQIEAAVKGVQEASGQSMASLQGQLRQAEEHISAAEMRAAAEAEALKQELGRVAAERKAEAAELAEAQAAASEKLSENLRWVDEENMRCRAEDEQKAGEGMAALRAELAGQIETLKGQVAEAIVPPGEPGALSTLRQALSRVDVLGEAVAQLCEYMQSLKVKEVAAAAEERLSTLEARSASGGGGNGVGGAAFAQVEARLDALERGLEHEQQSSLRALQAILDRSQG